MRVVIAALLLLPSHAFGWGSQGHQAIADAAQTRLDEKAQAALAAFYLNETKSHLNSAVRIRPVRNISGGGEFTLQPMLQGIEESGLAKLKSAIDAKDAKPFESAYRQTMAECHACHKLAGKPYLRPRIPEAPATRIIDMKPGTN